MSGKFYDPLALPLVPPRQKVWLRSTAALDLMSKKKCPASAEYGTPADEPVGIIKNNRLNVLKDLEGVGGEIFEGTAHTFV